MHVMLTSVPRQQPECVDEGKDLSLAVQNALDEAIKAYST